MNAAAPRGPLRNVRIVEFAGIGPAPFASMMLADMGADVLRLVRPGTGAPAVGEILSRGRRTVEVDLKNPVDVDSVQALLARADALVEGFRPGVMERLGLGPEPLLQRNPRLVYGRMTGWGQSGPMAQMAGHDINYISLSGALEAIGPAQRPVVPLNLVGDYGGGALYLVAGLLAALLEAKTTGNGQVVDAAMCDGAVSLMTAFQQLAAQGRWSEQREANLLDGGAHFYGVYACKDGRHLAVGPIEPQFYAELRERLGLAGDPQFDRQRDPAAWPELRERLAQVFLQRTRDEWAGVFAGSEACVTPVLSMSEAPGHPHLAARETFVRIDGVLQPAPAPRFSHTPSAARPPAAGLSTLDELLASW